MKFKKITAMLLSAAMMIGVQPSFSLTSNADEYETVTENGLIYYLYDEYATVRVDGFDIDSLGAKEFEIPSTIKDKPVTGIQEHGFGELRALEKIYLPDSITEIGGAAFYGCSALKEVNIPKTVTRIEDSTFTACEELSEIEIPDSISSIGGMAFNNCPKLKEIVIPDSVTSIGDDSFAYCTGIETVKLSDSLTNINTRAFNRCESLKSIVIPESVTNIGYAAFAGCTNLESIAILNPECTIYDEEGGGFTICNGVINEPEKDSEYYYDGVICGYPNSPLQEYAERYNYKFVDITAEPSIPLGDPTGDGKIDAKDSSFVLVEYSSLSTGAESKLTAAEKSAADVNKDGMTDSKDASAILGYYAYTSTGGDDTIETFLNK